MRQSRRPSIWRAGIGAMVDCSTLRERRQSTREATRIEAGDHNRRALRRGMKQGMAPSTRGGRAVGTPARHSTRSEGPARSRRMSSTRGGGAAEGRDAPRRGRRRGVTQGMAFSTRGGRAVVTPAQHSTRGEGPARSRRMSSTRGRRRGRSSGRPSTRATARRDAGDGLLDEARPRGGNSGTTLDEGRGPGTKQEDELDEGRRCGRSAGRPSTRATARREAGDDLLRRGAAARRELRHDTRRGARARHEAGG
jgi:hypothetical protein